MASTASIDLFINLIQNHPIVYDKTLKDFKNQRKKDEAWVNIANQSRMTVDATKKGYASLRQKYCREKRNLEVKRRNKQVIRKNWVFYEPLQFLDAFIIPRSTFTNDTGFEEDYEEDEEMIDEGILDDGNTNVDEDINSASQSIEIEVESGITFNELNDIVVSDDGNNLNPQTTCDLFGNSSNLYEEVISEYTGEVSRIDYNSQSDRNTVFLPNEEEVSDNAAEETRNEGLQQTRDNPDNYMSPYPTTSSSHINPSPAEGLDPSSQDTTSDKTSITLENSITTSVHRPNPIPNVSQNTSSSTQAFLQPSNNSKAGKPGSMSRERTTPTVVPRPILGNQLPPRSNENRSSSQQQHTLSRPDFIAPAIPRQNTTNSLMTSSKTGPTSSNQKSSQSRTANITSNEKSVEAIRHKMDSCLNAMASKMTDKAQRSPHAPFLAYLGTKLPNVRKEKLSDVEKEILEIVEYYSK